MTTRIYLARHGTTVLTAEDRFAGETDVALSDIGRRDARAIGARLASVPGFWREFIALRAEKLGMVAFDKSLVRVVRVVVESGRKSMAKMALLDDEQQRERA